MRAQEDDQVYYQQRERHCRAMAAQAGDPAVQQIHHKFAEAYARRLRAEAVRPASRKSVQSSSR